MDNRGNLPGLTPVWILVLASILAVLVGLGGEIVNRGVYEFLKDFQGAIVGVVAFSIAYWAAKPVYQQLTELRRQSAVQTFEMLQRLIGTIGSERKLVEDCRYQSGHATTFERALKDEPELSYPFVQAYVEELLIQKETADGLIDALNAARAHPWGNEGTWKLRDDLVTELRQLQVRRVELRGKLIEFKGKQINSIANWTGMTAEARQLSLSDPVSAVNEAAVAFRMAIDTEMKRLRPLMERATNLIYN